MYGGTDIFSKGPDNVIKSPRIQCKRDNKKKANAEEQGKAGRK